MKQYFQDNKTQSKILSQQCVSEKINGCCWNTLTLPVISVPDRVGEEQGFGSEEGE